VLIGRKVWGIEIRRRHLVAAMVALLLAGLTLAGSFGPAAGLRYGLVKVLRDLGMAHVSVSDADLSLLGGRVLIRKMVAEPPQGSALGIQDFALRFRWAPLLDKRLVVDRLALSGVEIDVARNPDTGALVINGLPLAVAAAAPGPTPAEPPSSWGIDLASLDISDSRLALSDGETRLDIAITRLVVENLHSRDAKVPVSFRLTGSLNGSAVTLSGSVEPFADQPAFTLNADISGLDLATFRHLAAQAGIQGLAGKADLSLAMGGTVRGADTSLRLLGRVSAEQLALTQPVLARLGHLALDIKKLEHEGGRTSLGLELKAKELELKADGAQANLAALDLALPRLAWDGKRLEIGEGKVGAAELAVSHALGKGSVRGLDIDLASLGWDGALSWQGGLALTGAKGEGEGVSAALDNARWAGRMDWSPERSRADGKLDLGQAVADVFGYSITLRQAGIEGTAEQGAEAVAAKARLGADGIAVSQTAKAMDWLALDHLEAPQLVVAADGALAVDRLVLAGLKALKKDGKGGFPWRVEAKSIALDHLTRDEDGDITLAELKAGDLLARVTRTKTGFLGLPEPDPKASAKPATAADDGPSVQLGRVVVGGDSRLIFEDRTLADTVRLEARPIQLTLRDIDMDKPNQDSLFDFSAEIGNSTIAAGGTVRPFATQPGGRLEGRIKALELPPLSPYLAEALGLNLYTGHFNGSFTGGSQAGRLDGKLDVDLSNLAMAPPAPGAPVTKGMDMPLETVLNLLRDGEGRIRLSFPVGGDLANPDIDISDAVAQAVTGALKSTMLATLKLAFPLAGLIELAMDEDDKGRLAIAPLRFEPGAQALSDEHKKILAAAAQLMKSRPGMTLTLCGKADDSDWLPVAKRKRAEDKPLLAKLENLVGVERKPADFGPPDLDLLAALADARATAAQEFMVDQAGIDAGRLFACRAQVEAGRPDPKGPRVELLL
jgi:hypothetical protein